MQHPECRLDVICAGDPAEMGRLQGQALRRSIRRARGALRRLEAFRLEQPWWMPFPAFRRVAERKASLALQRSLSTHSPALLSRIEGLADGAGLSLDSICLFNVLEAVMSGMQAKTSAVRPRPSNAPEHGDEAPDVERDDDNDNTDESVTPGLGACSAVAVRGARSATGEAIIARNFDYLPLVMPYYTLRESRPRDGFRSIEFTTAPMAGIVDGMNERGLAMTYNYAFVRDKPTVAMPISMQLAGALSACSTVSEAVAHIASQPRWGAGIVMLADATGDIASLELSNTRSEVRRPTADEDLLYHTNHFQTAAMREVEVSPQAIFSTRAPSVLRGRRVLESAEFRFNRLEHLFAVHRAFDGDELARLMGDHGLDDQGNGEGPDHRSVCMHSDYWSTTACAQFFPKSRRMRIAYTSACQAKYCEFGL